MDALVEECLKSSREGSRFQFERVGYFSVDPDSTQDKASMVTCDALHYCFYAHTARVQQHSRPEGESRLEVASSTKLFSQLIS